MRIESSYPTPILGVSTLAPRNRLKGQAGLQVNFRSDPVNKLTRRPPMKWVAPLLLDVTGEDFLNHAYERDNVIYRYLLNKVTGELHIFEDNVYKGSNQAPSGYVGTNMVAQTIDHDTYFLNTDKVVTMKADTDANVIEKVSHINVTSALNYNESVVVTVTKSDNTRHTVTYTIPDVGAAADEARATNQVALELAARINGGGTHQVRVPNPDYPDDPYSDVSFQTYCLPYISNGAGGCEVNPDYDTSKSVCNAFKTSYTGIAGVTAVAMGSSVAVWEDGRADWLDLEIETGQGDRSCVAFNRTLENTEGLPLYAVVGTRLTIKPDPTTEKGTYYLQAERISDTATGEPMEEVVWVESRNPDQPYALDETTLPLKCSLNNGVYTFTRTSFKDRTRGDDDSVPQPDFVGSTIANIGYFQKRLVFISENNVIMSETDDIQNFWKQSAVQLLVTDPVSLSSSATGIDRLSHVVPHNRDLLVIASNGQFKIDGSSAITPETISMALTTKYECQVNTAPVVMGNSVFFPIDYGDSSGLQEYTGERDTNQDFARPLTHHVIGYMDGKAKLLTASPNLEMLAMVTDGTSTNTVYIYEQYTDEEGRKVQRSWSSWVLGGDTKVLDIELRNDRLTIVAEENGNIVLKEVDMYSRVTTGINEVYLDDLVKLQTDGLTVTIPDNYVTSDMIIIRGDNTDYELNKAQFTLAGNTATFLEDISSGYVYIGKLYNSQYRPTRPFKYSEDGIAVTTDRIRIAKYILHLVETNEIKMKIISDYYETDDQIFNSRYVGGLNNKVGSVPLHTGDFKFSFAQDADLAEVEFYCDNWLGCTIAGLSWEGQYFQSKGRM